MCSVEWEGGAAGLGWMGTLVVVWRCHYRPTAGRSAAWLLVPPVHHWQPGGPLPHPSDRSSDSEGGPGLHLVLAAASSLTCRAAAVAASLVRGSVLQGQAKAARQVEGNQQGGPTAAAARPLLCPALQPGVLCLQGKL